MSITLLKLGPDGLPLDANPHIAGRNRARASYSDDAVGAPPLDRARLVGGGLYVAITLIWIAIAVMVGQWWMNRARSTPEPLDPQYQRMYVTVVAQRYSQTADLLRAQRDLIRWREKDLAQLLAAMQNETTNPMVRTQLAVLAAALGLPEPQSSALEWLVRGENVSIGAVFLLVPLFVAAGLGAARYLHPVSYSYVIVELPPEIASPEVIAPSPAVIQTEQQTIGLREEKEEEEQKPVEPAQEEIEDKSDGLDELPSLFGEEDTVG